MKEPKIGIRYEGFKALSNGGRRFDFSFKDADADPQRVSVEASSNLFSGPEHLALQECAGICYETLKDRASQHPGPLPGSIRLTLADIAQHRKLPAKALARRKRP